MSAFMTPIAEDYFGRIASRSFGLPQTNQGATPKQLEVAAQTRSWLKASHQSGTCAARARPMRLRALLSEFCDA